MTISDQQRDEIAAVRTQTRLTRRATSPAIEDILCEPFPVLDHGFLRVIDYMGDDAAIVQAARVSYGRGTRQAMDDAGLINYLMRRGHSSPFEMCEMKFHVKLPIFVARQWIRHRTASVNEYSARYSVLDREFYLPSPDQIAVQSTSNKQGRGDTLSADQAARVLDILRRDAETAYDHYEELLNRRDDGTPIHPERDSVARELARINLPLSSYTNWYWKVDLRNLLHFLGLRADSHAQYEIRVYADIMLDLVKRWVPHTHAAFMEHQFGAIHLSATAATVIARLLAGEDVTQQTSGLGRREWNELMTTFNRPTSA